MRYGYRLILCAQRGRTKPRIAIPGKLLTLAHRYIYPEITVSFNPESVKKCKYVFNLDDFVHDLDVFVHDEGVSE